MKMMANNDLLFGPMYNALDKSSRNSSDILTVNVINILIQILLLLPVLFLILHYPAWDTSL